MPRGVPATLKCSCPLQSPANAYLPLHSGVTAGRSMRSIEYPQFYFHEQENRSWKPFPKSSPTRYQFLIPFRFCLCVWEREIDRASFDFIQCRPRPITEDRHIVTFACHLHAAICKSKTTASGLTGIWSRLQKPSEVGRWWSSSTHLFYADILSEMNSLPSTKALRCPLWALHPILNADLL